jgi:hypothetical protein
MTGVDELLKKGGSTTAVAARLSTDERRCSHQLVQYWKEQGYVTPRWAPVVNRVYGIPLHKLNPAIYPKSAA